MDNIRMIETPSPEPKQSPKPIKTKMAGFNVKNKNFNESIPKSEIQNTPKPQNPIIHLKIFEY
jgi:hypothetical protein